MMNLALLWILHLALTCVAVAAGLAWSAGGGRARRALVLGVALLPLVALGYLTWRALALRFGFPLPHAPWRYASSLFIACVVGVAWVLRGRASAAARSRVGVTLALIALFAVEALLLANLQLRALLRMGQLGNEAGRLAFAVLAAKPAPADNAAPLIEEALAVAPQADGWTAFREVLEGADPPADDAELLAFLQELEPALALMHTAAERPRYQPEPAGDGLDWIVPPSVIGLLHLGQGLALSARVPRAGHDAADRAEDLRALQRLADHLLDTPTLISTMLATVLRGHLAAGVVAAIDRGELDAATAEAIRAHERTAMEAIADALRLEEAYGLSMLGAAADGSLDELTGSLPGDPVGALGLIFLLDAEVDAYRAVMAELLEVVEAGPRAAEPDDEELRGRGIVVRLIVPQVRPLLTAARRSDAESIVLQAAVAAHAEREATGALPRTLAALAGGDAELAERYADVVLEPRADGGLRLSHARFADAESGAPVVLELAGR